MIKQNTKPRKVFGYKLSINFTAAGNLNVHVCDI
jgi:hypothetical protein